MHVSRRQWSRSALIALACGALLFAGVYVYAINSEPYRFSEEWVRGSAEVRQRVGDVRKTHLSLRGGFGDHLRSGLREAIVSTYVEGERANLIVQLKLEKRSQEQWKVVAYCPLDP